VIRVRAIFTLSGTVQYVYESAHKLATLIREGQATSVDVVKEHVARIKERNGELNALVALFDAEALSVAAERDRQAHDWPFECPRIITVK
jgi:Asp-tRNA(Asn)/Glu-tRNA(Gln) amidotransferase A subunit family amidase